MAESFYFCYNWAEDYRVLIVGIVDPRGQFML